MLSITTDLAETDWIEAAKLRWSGCNVRLDVLLANVTITVNGAELVSSLGLAVGDFAYGLAQVVRAIELASEGEATVGELADCFTLHFSWNDTQLRIRESLSNRDAQLPISEFLAGARDFLSWFASVGVERVPDFLAWDELAVLDDYCLINEAAWRTDSTPAASADR